MARLRVIVCGGRDYTDRATVFAMLDQARDRIFEVVSGCARGADTLAIVWAEERGVPCKRFPANWKEHRLKAGGLRNQQMADYADAVIAFPGGSGTADMIRRAKRMGLPVWIPVRRAR